MIVILNSKTHVGANPPSDTTKTWISADMTEISIYPEPETYGRLNARIDVKAILLAHNLDIRSDRIRVFSLADEVLEVKRYINGEWIVIDNPNDYVDIIMNDKVIGTIEVDSIAPGEQVEEWDGTGVVIAPTEPEQLADLIGVWRFNRDASYSLNIDQLLVSSLTSQTDLIIGIIKRAGYDPRNIVLGGFAGNNANANSYIGLELVSDSDDSGIPDLWYYADGSIRATQINYIDYIEFNENILDSSLIIDAYLFEVMNTYFIKDSATTASTVAVAEEPTLASTDTPTTIAEGTSN